MKTLVTGGGGFLGQYIVEQLLEAGHQVRVFSRGSYPELEKRGAELFSGNIRNSSHVDEACKNIDCVFHTAAKVSMFGNYHDYFQTNVLGTQHVIHGCQKNNIHKLIFTSSSSVAYHGTDQLNANESTPYPKTYLSAYSETKALSEKLIRHANGQKELLTVSLRPHLIWGPRDKYIIPRLLEQGKKGKLWIVGTGKNLTDITYVENIAKAHLLAAEHLIPKSPICGKVYYITQGKPVLMWEWINEVLGHMNIPPVTKHISFKTAY
ncbi:MAG: 3-beta hydroxysteroid dehydrogenase, partial [Deltaproteobacteria bacterium RIFCSPLOWO2_01_FULL_38_9]